MSFAPSSTVARSPSRKPPLAVCWSICTWRSATRAPARPASAPGRCRPGWGCTAGRRSRRRWPPTAPSSGTACSRASRTVLPVLSVLLTPLTAYFLPLAVSALVSSPKASSRWGWNDSNWDVPRRRPRARQHDGAGQHAAPWASNGVLQGVIVSPGIRACGATRRQRRHGSDGRAHRPIRPREAPRPTRSRRRRRRTRQHGKQLMRRRGRVVRHHSKCDAGHGRESSREYTASSADRLSAASACRRAGASKRPYPRPRRRNAPPACPKRRLRVGAAQRGRA